MAVNIENEIASNARKIKKMIVAGGDHVVHPDLHKQNKFNKKTLRITHQSNQI
jgi:hypothetical protein